MASLSSRGYLNQIDSLIKDLDKDRVKGGVLTQIERLGLVRQLVSVYSTYLTSNPNLDLEEKQSVHKKIVPWVAKTVPQTELLTNFNSDSEEVVTDTINEVISQLGYQINSIASQEAQQYQQRMERFLQQQNQVPQSKRKHLVHEWFRKWHKDLAKKEPIKPIHVVEDLNFNIVQLIQTHPHPRDAIVSLAKSLPKEARYTVALPQKNLPTPVAKPSVVEESVEIKKTSTPQSPPSSTPPPKPIINQPTAPTPTRTATSLENVAVLDTKTITALATAVVVGNTLKSNGYSQEDVSEVTQLVLNSSPETNLRILAGVNTNQATHIDTLRDSSTQLDDAVREVVARVSEGEEGLSWIETTIPSSSTNSIVTSLRQTLHQTPKLSAQSTVPPHQDPPTPTTPLNPSSSIPPTTGIQNVIPDATSETTSPQASHQTVPIRDLGQVDETVVYQVGDTPQVEPSSPLDTSSPTPPGDSKPSTSPSGDSIQRPPSPGVVDETTSDLAPTETTTTPSINEISPTGEVAGQISQPSSLTAEVVAPTQSIPPQIVTAATLMTPEAFEKYYPTLVASTSPTLVLTPPTSPQPISPPDTQSTTQPSSTVPTATSETTPPTTQPGPQATTPLAAESRLDLPTSSNQSDLRVPVTATTEAVPTTSIPEGASTFDTPTNQPVSGARSEARDVYNSIYTQLSISQPTSPPDTQSTTQPSSTVPTATSETTPPTTQPGPQATTPLAVESRLDLPTSSNQSDLRVPVTATTEAVPTTSIPEGASTFDTPTNQPVDYFSLHQNTPKLWEIPVNTNNNIVAASSLNQFNSEPNTVHNLGDTHLAALEYSNQFPISAGDSTTLLFLTGGSDEQIASWLMSSHTRHNSQNNPELFREFTSIVSQHRQDLQSALAIVTSPDLDPPINSLTSLGLTDQEFNSRAETTLGYWVHTKDSIQIHNPISLILANQHSSPNAPIFYQEGPYYDVVTREISLLQEYGVVSPNLMWFDNYVPQTQPSPMFGSNPFLTNFTSSPAPLGMMAGFGGMGTQSDESGESIPNQPSQQSPSISQNLLNSMKQLNQATSPSSPASGIKNMINNGLSSLINRAAPLLRAVFSAILSSLGGLFLSIAPWLLAILAVAGVLALLISIVDMTATHVTYVGTDSTGEIDSNITVEWYNNTKPGFDLNTFRQLEAYFENRNTSGEVPFGDLVPDKGPLKVVNFEDNPGEGDDTFSTANNTFFFRLKLNTNTDKDYAITNITTRLTRQNKGVSTPSMLMDGNVLIPSVDIQGLTLTNDSPELEIIFMGRIIDPIDPINGFRDALIGVEFDIQASSTSSEGCTASETVCESTNQIFTIAYIRVGDAPEVPTSGPGCPSVWPVDTSKGQKYTIVQGPGGNSTHGPPQPNVLTSGGDGILPPHEAIDIHPSGDRSNLYLLASHPGEVVFSGRGDSVTLKNGKTVEGALQVYVKGTCGGDDFVSRYIHLDSISVARGQVVETGDLIGVMGCTGYCADTHLHYEFRSPNQSFIVRDGISIHPSWLSGIVVQKPIMDFPFIPKKLPFNLNADPVLGGYGCLFNCNVSIP